MCMDAGLSTEHSLDTWPSTLSFLWHTAHLSLWEWQIILIEIHCDAWKWVPDPFPSVTIDLHYKTLPLPLPLMLTLDARCVYTLRSANEIQCYISYLRLVSNITYHASSGCQPLTILFFYFFFICLLFSLTSTQIRSQPIACSITRSLLGLCYQSRRISGRKWRQPLINFLKKTTKLKEIWNTYWMVFTGIPSYVPPEEAWAPRSTFPSLSAR